MTESTRGLQMRYYSSKPDKLQLLYDYILDYDRKFFDGEIENCDDWANNRNPKAEIYSLASFLYEFNGFPKILTNEAFDGFNSAVIYHGLAKHEHGANYLWDPMYHMGHGNYGGGVYFSTNFDDASVFTCGLFKDDTKIITAKLNSNKIIKYSVLEKIMQSLKLPNLNKDFSLAEDLNLRDDIKKRLVEFKTFLREKYRENRDDAWDFIYLLSQNISALGVVLGVDAIENDDRPDFYRGKHIIVLNREKLFVPEKCAKTIFEKSGGEYSNVNYQITELSEINKI